MMTILLWIAYFTIGALLARWHQSSTNARRQTRKQLVDTTILLVLFWFLMALAAFCSVFYAGIKKRCNKPKPKPIRRDLH